MTDWKKRYAESYKAWQLIAYPASSKDFGTLPVKYPDVTKANGLTNFVMNFLKWNNHRSTRINVSGRLIEQPEKQASGIVLGTKKWMHSMTRKGTADISATIHGRSCMFEIKAGRDKPREHQLKEQELERSAGGQYEFIYTPEQFLEWYDQFIKSII
jgi:hypothetical protein